MQLNETRTLNEIDGVGNIVPIKYYTYLIPFQYIFKQYPSEIITASFTDPLSPVLTVSLNVNTLNGKNNFFNLKFRLLGLFYNMFLFVCRYKNCYFMSGYWYFF